MDGVSDAPLEAVVSGTNRAITFSFAVHFFAVSCARFRTLPGRRHSTRLASLAACASLLTACVGISATELQSSGSKVPPENINFGEVYTYAERASAACATKSVIAAKYPRTRAAHN